MRRISINFVSVLSAIRKRHIKCRRWRGGNVYLQRSFHPVVQKLERSVSPQAYVVRARIERAGTLLSNSNLTISEVADQLNYSSVNFFHSSVQAGNRHNAGPVQKIVMYTSSVYSIITAGLFFLSISQPNAPRWTATAPPLLLPETSNMKRGGGK